MILSSSGGGGVFENGAIFLIIQTKSQLLYHRVQGTQKTVFSFSCSLVLLPSMFPSSFDLSYNHTVM